MRFLIQYYIWSVRCKRFARFYLFDLDTIIISLDLISKYFGYRKVKTIRIYVWIGLTIIFSFEKDFENLNRMVAVYSHQSHD